MIQRDKKKYFKNLFFDFPYKEKRNKKEEEEWKENITRFFEVIKAYKDDYMSYLSKKKINEMWNRLRNQYNFSEILGGKMRIQGLNENYYRVNVPVFPKVIDTIVMTIMNKHPFIKVVPFSNNQEHRDVINNILKYYQKKKKISRTVEESC